MNRRKLRLTASSLALAGMFVLGACATDNNPGGTTLPGTNTTLPGTGTTLPEMGTTTLPGTGSSTTTGG